LGNRTDVLQCSQALDAEPFFPLPSENTANSGKIVAKIGGSDFEIDFLHSPNGLSPAEVKELALSITFETIPLKVLHPLHCVESKTVNLATLSQDAGGRQDLKHLRLSIASLRQHLIKLTLDGGSEPLLLRWAHRIRTNSNHDLGLLATIKHGVQFQEAIPADIWQTRPGPLADFVNKEWQEWKEENAKNTSDLRDLESWLKSLNDKGARADLP
jgi:hypothetical protein